MGVVVAHRLCRPPSAAYTDGALGEFDHWLALTLARSGGGGGAHRGNDLLQAISVDIEIACTVVRDRRHRVLDLGNRLLGDRAFEVRGEGVAIRSQGRRR